jgi:hypothetical protein
MCSNFYQECCRQKACSGFLLLQASLNKSVLIPFPNVRKGPLRAIRALFVSLLWFNVNPQNLHFKHMHAVVSVLAVGVG